MKKRKDRAGSVTGCSAVSALPALSGAVARLVSKSIFAGVRVYGHKQTYHRSKLLNHCARTRSVSWPGP